MSATVICGYGGVGKTELAKKYKNVVDLESIFWKWNYHENIATNIEHYKIYKYREANTNFPYNYINAIKENINKYDIVLVAYSDTIIQSLKENNIDFLLCYPTEDSKDIYMQRYKNRGNNEELINIVGETFEEEINEAKKLGLPSIILKGHETLEDHLIKDGYHLEKREVYKKFDIN